MCIQYYKSLPQNKEEKRGKILYLYNSRVV